jgi:hypothetical protein
MRSMVAPGVLSRKIIRYTILNIALLRQCPTGDFTPPTTHRPLPNCFSLFWIYVMKAGSILKDNRLLAVGYQSEY